jgi:hypothetical protein
VINLLEDCDWSFDTKVENVEFCGLRTITEILQNKFELNFLKFKESALRTSRISGKLSSGPGK